MHKFLLAAVVGATALTGCDFSDGAAPASPVSIAAVEVSGLPATFRGANWDADGNPDVFVELRNPAGRAFYRSEPVLNADVSETLTFTVEEAVFAGSPTAPLIVAVFDMDENLVVSQEMSSSAAFTPEDLEVGDVTPGANNGSIVIRSSATQ